MAQPNIDPKAENQLMQLLWDPRLADDINAYVQFVFPWKEPDTPLERHAGPRKWQSELFKEISQHVVEQKEAVRLDEVLEMFRKATASGRGIGKSAGLAMLTHWFMTTRIGGSVVVTANTEAQLKNKTWGELGKWFSMAINSHWFDISAKSIVPEDWLATAVKRQLKIDPTYWYAKAELWSEENPDAFAGLHNERGVLLLMDEASGIPSPIWTVSEGFFTEPIVDRYWLAFSNPRRNKGGFYDCFNRLKHNWRRDHIDARDVEGSDKQVYQSIIDKYGIDSDEVRIEVKGRFPRAGKRQLIPVDVAEGAQEREINSDALAPLVMGVDPARSGDDRSVIRFRRGRDARSIPPTKFSGLDNMQLAYECANLIDRYKPDAVCIDAGNGTGVIDRLRDLGYKVHEIWFSGKATRRDAFNKRTSMWMDMADWMQGGSIDADEDLFTDLIAPEYDFVGHDGVVKKLQSKEDLKSEGMASPDDGDALCLTFAVRVARKDNPSSRHRRNPAIARADGVDYDMFD